MKTVGITLFDKMTLVVDGTEHQLDKAAAEFLALVCAFGGNKVTAKDTWECISKPLGRKYNSNYYTEHLMALRGELALLDISDIIITGNYPVRSCRIDMTKVQCDYYRMLDNIEEMLPKERFLPEFAWAADYYCESREALNALWCRRHGRIAVR